MRRIGLTAVAVVLASACAEGPPTYADDVKPILDARCTACHQEGGAGPMPLVTYDDAQFWAAAIAYATEHRIMPPWRAGDGCAEYADDRALSDDEIATIGAWAEAGAPSGDLAKVSVDVAPKPELPRVDLALDLQGPYTPSLRDEYRCFVVELPVDAPTYVTGYDVVPGVPTMVHHVNVFLTAPDKTASFVAKQDADAAPGYDCARGRMDTGSGLLGAWAPGAAAVVYPDDSGILIEPGASLVLEVHYHLHDGEEPPPDQSAILLQTSTTVSRRGVGGAIYDFLGWPAEGGMMIEAGDASSTHEYSLDVAPFVEQVAPWLTSNRVRFHVVGMHMHYLGRSGSLWIQRPDENVCLLDIPDWDFDWQLAYTLKEPVEMVIGRDTIYVECTFDNSDENQPVVDGVKQKTETRYWGEKTTDEMCMGLFYVTEER